MSEAPGSSYAADFTSVKATKEGPCETCGTTAVLKHMQSKERSKLGRDLCPNCYQYYRNKNGTVRRSSIQTPAASQVERAASHRHDVHKQVAQAQRGPNRFNDVQAIGGSNQVTEQGHPAGPVPVGYVANTSSGPLRTPGPSIHLPGNIRQYPSIPPSMHQNRIQPQAVGYTQAHASYSTERHQRVQQAFSTHNAEVVVIEVRMVLMPPGRVQMQLINDLVEAVDHIPVHIGAEALKKTLYNALIPRWNRWTNNYPLDIDQIMMRDKMWVILSPTTPDCDAIAKFFFKTGKKGNRTFKTGKTTILLHVPNELYDDMLEKKESADEWPPEKNTERRTAGRKCTARVKDVEPSMAADFTVAVSKGKRRARSASLTPEEGPEDHSSNSIEIMPVPVMSPSKRATSSGLMKKRRVETTPTRSQPRELSPSAEHISRALRTQQLPMNKEMSSLLCLTTFNVVVYPVECQTWAQLLDQTADSEPTQPEISIGKEGNNFYLGKPMPSTLQLDLTTSNLKKGGFKLAAFGTSMPSVFKDGVDSEAICAKRTYSSVERVAEVKGSLTKKIVRVPHEGEKQFQNLAMEVSCLVWAQALLDIVYDFIKEESDSDLEGSKRLPILPFHVPQFRFVKAAIAIEQSSSTSVKKTSFLLEEVIDPNKEGPFRKFLNNVSPEPLVMKTKDDEERARFLAFSQHVQYWKTKKQVFVSDYQGGNMLLSDPQISSAGALGPIFAEGNIPAAHRDFETSHCCNVFCKWFKVPAFKHNSESHMSNII